jgi:hypothetical protein
MRPQGLMCLALYASVMIERRQHCICITMTYKRQDSGGRSQLFVSALRMPEGRFQLLGQRISQTEMG